MSDHQVPLPERIWINEFDWFDAPVSVGRDYSNAGYIRADIAERMAEALEAVLSVAQWVSAEQVCALKQVSEALSDFRSATPDTEARHD